MSEQHEKSYVEISEDAEEQIDEQLKEKGYVTGREILEAIGIYKLNGCPEYEKIEY